MDIVNVRVTPANPQPVGLRPVEVQAPVETRAITLCVPQHATVRLELQESERREVTAANGKREVVCCIGPAKITCLGRSCDGGALVLGDRVLLGAIPMGAIPLEDMDLVISPAARRVAVDPESSNIPSAIAMQIRSHVDTP